MRLPHLLLCALTLAGNLHAQVPKEGGLRSKVWRIPSGVVSLRDPMEKPRDAREYLKQRGVEIPPEGEAIFDPANSSLTVRASQSAIEQVNKILAEAETRGPAMVVVEFTLAEFVSPAGTDAKDPTYSELRALAGDKWVVVNRFSVPGKSGQKVVSSSINRMKGAATARKTAAAAKAKTDEEEPEEPTSITSFKPDDWGTIVEVEPQISPDGRVVDLNFVYSYHGPAGENREPVSIHSVTSVGVDDGKPFLLQTNRFATPPDGKAQAGNREMALVLRCVILGTDGTRLNKDRPPFAPK